MGAEQLRIVSHCVWYRIWGRPKGLRRARFTGGWLAEDTERLEFGEHAEQRDTFPVVDLENNEGAA